MILWFTVRIEYFVAVAGLIAIEAAWRRTGDAVTQRSRSTISVFGLHNRCSVSVNKA